MTILLSLHERAPGSIDMYTATECKEKLECDEPQNYHNNHNVAEHVDLVVGIYDKYSTVEIHDTKFDQRVGAKNKMLKSKFNLLMY